MRGTAGQIYHDADEDNDDDDDSAADGIDVDILEPNFC